MRKATGKDIRDMRLARPRAKLTPGQMLRQLRVLQEMSRAELAVASGFRQSTTSSMETGAVPIGVARARKLADALKVHPGVLLFPDWSPSWEVGEPVYQDARATTRKLIAADLRAARHVAGLSQTELAKRMGKGQPMVARAEAGETRVGERYVKAVLKACGLPEDWVVP